jgi:hypothetical protein
MTAVMKASNKTQLMIKKQADDIPYLIRRSHFLSLGSGHLSLFYSKISKLVSLRNSMNSDLMFGFSSSS